jgi:hypothetical protein
MAVPSLYDVCMKRIALSLSLALTLALSHPLAEAGKAHEHGVMALDVAVQANQLTLSLRSPLDSFLGFERAPRTDAERAAAATLLERLKKAEGLFKLDPAAQCTLAQAEVNAPVLQPGAPSPGDGHADLDADYTYTCAQPQALRSVEVTMFDSYKRLQRINVQIAGAKAQSKATLRPNARVLRLVP